MPVLWPLFGDAGYFSDQFFVDDLKMKLKLSLSKLRNNWLVDNVEQTELRGTTGHYKLLHRAAPLATPENDAEFRSFPDFQFLHVERDPSYGPTETTQLNFFTELISPVANVKSNNGSKLG